MAPNVWEVELPDPIEAPSTSQAKVVIPLSSVELDPSKVQARPVQLTLMIAEGSSSDTTVTDSLSESVWAAESATVSVTE